MACTLWTFLFLVMELMEGSHQLTPTVPEGGYCVDEQVEFTCTRRIGRIDGTTYDSLEWQVVTANVTQLSTVVFIEGLDQAGRVAPLSVRGTSVMLQATLVSVNSTVMQSTLRMTVVPELNNIIIVCRGGGIVNSTSPILVTSSVPSQPQSVWLRNFQNNSATATVTVQWDAPVGSAVDNYSIAITPLPPSGAPSPTTNTQINLTLRYNVPYSLDVTATNCLGRGDTNTYTFELVNCSAPSAASGVVMEPYSITTEGAVIHYNCDVGLVPNERVMSVCASNGTWVPDPQHYVCSIAPPVMCEQPQPPINGTLGDIPSTLAGSTISFRCNEGLFPPGQLSAMCSDSGKWQPNPAEVNCTSVSFNCSAPPQPLNGYFETVMEGTLMFGCDVGYVPQRTITVIQCVAADTWRPDPADFTCSMEETTPGDSGSGLSGGAIGGGIVAGLLFIAVVIILVIMITVIVVRKKGSPHKPHTSHMLEMDSVNDEKAEYSVLNHPGPRGVENFVGPENALVYVDVGPSSIKRGPDSGAGVRHDDHCVEYSELTHGVQQPHPKLIGSGGIHPADQSLNLDSLLIQLKPQVTSKWDKFAAAVGIDETFMRELANLDSEVRMVEMLDHWLRSHVSKPTWREVAEILKKIHLYKLAADILKVYETGNLPIVVDMSEVPEGTLPRNEPPPPLPPKMDFDSELSGPPLAAMLPPKPPRHGGGSRKAPPPVPAPYDENAGTPPPVRPHMSHDHRDPIAPPRPPKSSLANDAPARPPKPVPRT